MTKWVYAFGADGADGRADMRNLLGGKGANLAEMSGRASGPADLPSAPKSVPTITPMAGISRRS